MIDRSSSAHGHFAAIRCDEAHEEHHMTISVKSLFAGAALVSALALTVPVSAATIITPLVGGPFSLANPLGTLPATVLSKGNTYDFTFTLVPPLNGGTFSVQAQAQTTGPTAASQLISYNLFEGTPGSGVLIGSSSLDFSPVVAFSPVADNYYMEITYIAKSGEVASGSIFAAVPEPAAWSMMLVGFGLLGGALRRRARTAAVAA
jgi:hypothetical protein